MKFKFSTSPNYQNPRTIQMIMRDLTIGLLIVYAFALIKYFNLGSAYGIHVILMLLLAEVTSFAIELIYYKIFKATLKQTIKEYINTSFPWITPLILVLMCPANATYYAIFISTMVAVVFAKMLFGGFGQNIFNPAAVGRAIFFTVATNTTANLVTGATPTASFASFGWVMNFQTFEEFIGNYHGLLNMFVGNYYGALGETSALVMIIIGIFLSVRKVIDWHVPVVYLATIFVGSSIIALNHGMGIYYPIFNLLTGGAVFGAVFMLTDPVTNPTTRAGRVLFALLAGVITLLIRVKANLPEGVLYSILIVNMFVPVIDDVFAGNQLDKKASYIKTIVITAVVSVLIIFAVSTSLDAKEGTMPETASTNVSLLVNNGGVTNE